jgi:transposase-like protein
MKSLRCPNKECSLAQKTRSGNIIVHGFYKTKWGKRRRYRCRTCGKTFCSNSGTPYHRLQHRRATFDEVASLSVEGLNKSALARVKRIAWNTVHHWVEKAAEIWARNPDASHAGWIDNQAAVVQGDFLRNNAFCCAAKCHVCVLLFCLFNRCE